MINLEEDVKRIILKVVSSNEYNSLEWETKRNVILKCVDKHFQDLEREAQWYEKERPAIFKNLTISRLDQKSLDVPSIDRINEWINSTFIACRRM